MIIKMAKNGKVATFHVFQDCTYRVLNGTKWSDISEDFGDAYIKLREAGWEECND